MVVEQQKKPIVSFFGKRIKFLLYGRLNAYLEIKQYFVYQNKKCL